jgi:hypothetical protein
MIKKMEYFLIGLGAALMGGMTVIIINQYFQQK